MHLWLRKPYCPLSLAALLLTAGLVQAQTRPTGPVRLQLTGLVVQPCKSNGIRWDLKTECPEEAMKQQRRQDGDEEWKGLIGAIASAAGGIPGKLLALVPWATSIILRGQDAPDPRVTITLNGSIVAQGATKDDTYTPMWTDATTGALTIGPQDRIRIDVVDVDPDDEESIGFCTILGMPLIDDQGYVIKKVMHCEGQIRVLGLAVMPVASETVAASAPPSAAVAAEQAGSVVPAPAATPAQAPATDSPPPSSAPTQPSGGTTASPQQAPSYQPPVPPVYAPAPMPAPYVPAPAPTYVVAPPAYGNSLPVAPVYVGPVGRPPPPAVIYPAPPGGRVYALPPRGYVAPPRYPPPRGYPARQWGSHR